MAATVIETSRIQFLSMVPEKRLYDNMEVSNSILLDGKKKVDLRLEETEENGSKGKQIDSAPKLNVNCE